MATGPAVFAIAIVTPASNRSAAAVIVPPIVPLAIENPRLELSPLISARTLNRLSVKKGSTPVTRLNPTPKLIPISIFVATFTLAAAVNVCENLGQSHDCPLLWQLRLGLRCSRRRRVGAGSICSAHVQGASFIRVLDCLAKRERAWAVRAPYQKKRCLGTFDKMGTAVRSRWMPSIADTMLVSNVGP